MAELEFTDEASERRARVRLTDPTLSANLERCLADLAGGRLSSHAFPGGRRLSVFGVYGRDTEYLIFWRAASPGGVPEVLAITERPR